MTEDREINKEVPPTQTKKKTDKSSKTKTPHCYEDMENES